MMLTNKKARAAQDIALLVVGLLLAAGGAVAFAAAGHHLPAAFQNSIGTNDSIAMMSAGGALLVAAGLLFAFQKYCTHLK